MKKPAVTVLLPVYNSSAYLRQAIDSILSQTFTDFELLIINDGSTDNSKDIINSYQDKRIRVIDRPNKGLIATLNEGIGSAQAELIARMDADDLSQPKRLERQYKAMTKRPELLLMGTWANVIDDRGTVISERPKIAGIPRTARALAVMNPFIHGSIMVRKSAVLMVGGYRDQAYLVEDYDLWVRLAAQGEVDNYPEVLYSWRVNPHGESLQHQPQQAVAATRLARSAWRSYGLTGPAPLSLWPSVWPKTNSSDQHSDALLHSLFGTGYLRRGYIATGLRHIIEAIKTRSRKGKND